MATIAAEQRIRRALKAKLPPTTQYHIDPSDDFLVYREHSKEWQGLFNVKKVFRKQVFVDWDGVEKQFNIVQVVPAPRYHVDKALHRLLHGMEHFSSNTPPGVFVTEVLHHADPHAHFGIFDEAKLQEMEEIASAAYTK